MAARVLVVDDEPGMRLLGQMMLEERGFAVEVAADGDEALARCARESFDAVVLDNKMPRLTGVDVLRELRARGDATPVFVYSGYLEPGVVAEAERLGARMVDKSETERLVALLSELPKPTD